MQIKRILTILLVIAVPIFAWYVYLNPLLVSSLKINLSSPYVLSAFFASSCLMFAGHVLRAYKTRLNVDPVKPTSLRTHTRALFIGYLFNTLLPFRIGEVFRAAVLGKGTKVSSSFLFSLIVLERAIDGLVLAVIAFAFLLFTDVFAPHSIHVFILVTASVITAGSIAALTLLYFLRKPHRAILNVWHRFTKLFNDDLQNSLRFKMWSAIYGLQRVINRKQMVRFVGYSILMWAIYFIALVPLISAFIGQPVHLSHFATALVSYLGIAAPSGPAHLGSYQSAVQPYLATAPQQAINLRDLLGLLWVLQVIPAALVGMVFVYRTHETLEKPAAPARLQAVHDKLLRDVDISHDLSTFLDAFFTHDSISQMMHQLEIDKNSKLIKYFKGGSSAVTALVYENNRFVVRKLTPIQYKYKLESQYDWLRDKSHLDRIVNAFDDETTASYYKIDLEYNEEYIPFIDYIHSMPIDKSKRIIGDVFDYLFENVYHPEPLKTRPADLRKLIENRCLGKIRQAAEVNDDIRNLMTYEELIINGERYRNIPHIIADVLANPQIFNTLATYRHCSIHGDTTIDNILASKRDDSYLIIDPTDNENEISGPVHDFGRLAQSLSYGYEFLCRDERKADVVDNQIEFDYTISNNYAELEKHVEGLHKKYLEPQEQQAVMFHAAVLYSRMLTHRVVINPANAAKFYAVSVIAFNRFMDGLNKPAGAKTARPVAAGRAKTTKAKSTKEPKPRVSRPSHKTPR